VRVVKGDGSIDVRTVQVGRRQGPRWIVTAGLHAGDRVVVDAPTLRAGTKVVARAATADDAPAEAAPTPRREAP